MSKTSYYTIESEIIGERTPGLGRREYMPDALGSVTATIVGSAKENDYKYKPYGLVLSSSIVGTDPSFLWVGTLGYKRGQSSSFYVRARHYTAVRASWLSVDTLWPMDALYAYSSNPVGVSDPSCEAPYFCCR